jgi:hypothetical protein
MEEFYRFRRLITVTFNEEGQMSKIKLIFSLVIIGIIGLVMAVYAADVTGEWELTTESPRGERTSAVKFVQDGEKLTVTMEDRRGGEMEGKGTVKGNNIGWTFVRSTPRGEFEMVYKGTIDGNTMSGTVDFGGRGEMEWTANKK